MFHPPTNPPLPSLPPSLPLSMSPRRWSLRRPTRPRSLYPLTSLRPVASSIRPRVNEPPVRIVVATEASRPRRTARRAIMAALVAGIAISAGVATMQSTRNAMRTLTPVVVSGTAGLKTTPSGKHERWASRPLTVTFDASLDKIDPAAKDAVKAAFGEWASSDGSLPQLVFDSSKAHGKVAQDGINLILFGPITIKGHEQDVATTVSYVDTSTGEIVEADTIFNSAFSFTVLGEVATNASDDQRHAAACASRYDLQNVATHEAGHLFGLGEDVDDAHATMYLRSGVCETHKRALTDADRGVIASLYGEPSPGAPVASAQAKGCSR